MAKEEQSSDPPFPIPLGKDNTHVLHQPSDIHVCIFQEQLGYVISIPSAHKRTFIVVRMILILVLMDQENFLYVDVGNPI
jgi:hypothetical protein